MTDLSRQMGELDVRVQTQDDLAAEQANTIASLLERLDTAEIKINWLRRKVDLLGGPDPEPLTDGSDTEGGDGSGTGSADGVGSPASSVGGGDGDRGAGTFGFGGNRLVPIGDGEGEEPLREEEALAGREAPAYDDHRLDVLVLGSVDEPPPPPFTRCARCVDGEE